MKEFINCLTGTKMLVADEREQEYLAAGHRPVRLPEKFPAVPPEAEESGNQAAEQAASAATPPAEESGAEGAEKAAPAKAAKPAHSAAKKPAAAQRQKPAAKK